MKHPSYDGQELIFYAILLFVQRHRKTMKGSEAVATTSVQSRKSGEEIRTCRVSRTKKVECFCCFSIGNSLILKRKADILYKYSRKGLNLEPERYMVKEAYDTCEK